MLSVHVIGSIVEQFRLVFAVPTAQLDKARLTSNPFAVVGYNEDRGLSAVWIFFQPQDWVGGPNEQMI